VGLGGCVWVEGLLHNLFFLMGLRVAVGGLMLACSSVPTLRASVGVGEMPLVRQVSTPLPEIGDDSRGGSASGTSGNEQWGFGQWGFPDQQHSAGGAGGLRRSGGDSGGGGIGGNASSLRAYTTPPPPRGSAPAPPTSLPLSVPLRATSGKSGLRNLGNTCFMNSIIQCLSMTTPLTQYWLTGQFKRDVDATKKGSLAVQFAHLIEELWQDGLRRLFLLQFPPFECWLVWFSRFFFFLVGRVRHRGCVHWLRTATKINVIANCRLQMFVSTWKYH
jgi:hypothetical protein